MGRAGETKDVKWHDVHVGMMLEVRDNENIPADLLCLHCSHADNVCFIKTVNLDGEPQESPLAYNFVENLPTVEGHKQQMSYSDHLPNP